MTESIESQRRVWNRTEQRFVTNEEAVSTLASGRFLKGPVPWSWIVTAAELPSRALVVGLCLWRLAGAIKRHTVMLGNAEMEALGIDRAAKSRALVALEQAGLITVVREPGRFPLVTLVTGEETAAPRSKRKPRARARKPIHSRTPRGGA